MEKFSITPCRISHNEKPAFHASWFSGEIKAPDDGQISFYYEGSGGDDRLLIYQIEWLDEKPEKEQFNQIMNEAITVIDCWITARF